MKEGWICPKCGRVWGPDIWGCQDCNKTPVKQAKMPAPHKHQWYWTGDGWMCSICGGYNPYPHKIWTPSTGDGYGTETNDV